MEQAGHRMPHTQADGGGFRALTGVSAATDMLA